MSGKGKGGRGKGKTGGGKSTTKSVKAGLQFPVGRIGRYLKNGKYATRLGAGAPVYLCAVLEYLCAEILELAGNAARDAPAARRRALADDRDVPDRAARRGRRRRGRDDYGRRRRRRRARRRARSG